MRLSNWAHAFEERPLVDDVLGRVRKTEIEYWIWMGISVWIEIVGIAIVFLAPSNSVKLHAIGLFLILQGGLAWAVVKVRTHISLALCWSVWDRQNRLAGEQLRVEAHDL